MKHFYRYRSSITGLWVSQAFALRNPDTTEREQVEIDSTSPHRTHIDYLTNEFIKAPMEDKAEWLLEIVDAYQEWRKVLIGAEIAKPA